MTDSDYSDSVHSDFDRADYSSYFVFTLCYFLVYQLPFVLL